MSQKQIVPELEPELTTVRNIVSDIMDKASEQSARVPVPEKGVVSEIPEQKMVEQEAITVSPEMLLAQIVANVGEEFVIIPTAGWMAIVGVIKDYDSGNHDIPLLEELENLGVPVIPVSLAKKKLESSIIMPHDTPQGDSKIILP